MGYVWSLLRPLLLFVILYIVFVKFLRIGEGVPHYPVYLLLGIVLWNLFAEITNSGVAAIVGHGDLIRKLNFPKYVIVLSVAFSALINLLFNLIVISVFIYISKVDIGWQVLLAPLFILEIFVFAVALAFILSALFVRLRDINYIWEVLMQAGFYATPILYPLTMVSEKWPSVAQLLLLNPVAQAIQDVRQLVITPETQTLAELSGGRWWLVVVPYIIIVGFTLFAIIFFKKRSPYFAEEV